MRLLRKDRLPLLLFYLLQMLLVSSLYWLSGENRPISIMLYGIALSTVVLLLYLGYRYFQYRKLYAALSDPISKSVTKEHLVTLGATPYHSGEGIRMNFPQFAFNNVKRNSRAYFSYFLSSTFMVMIFFSYSVFIYHPGVTSIELGTNSAAGMKIASYIVFVFAFFFILYSISAFLKMRNMEFGILMMLGARSGQINKLILIENMLIGLLSILTGMSFGMLLSKLFLLLSTTIMGLDQLPFYWPVMAIIVTSISYFKYLHD